MPRRPPEPDPYDDPFCGFNLLKYGPDEPISIVRPKPICPPGTIFVGDPTKHTDFAPPPTQAEATEPKNGGRPTKIDPVKEEAFCALVRGGCSRSEAARLIGVNRRTIWYAARNDPAFKERILDAERQCEALAYSNVARAGATSWRASAWLINRRQRRRERARAPSVRAVLRNREFQAQLKNLVKQLLSTQADEKPREDPDLDLFRRRDRQTPSAQPKADGADADLGGVRSRLLGQIQSLCDRRAHTECTPNEIKPSDTQTTV